MTGYDKRGWKYRKNANADALRKAAQAARDQAVADIRLKLKTRPQVAQEMGVTLRTVNEWVWAQAKKDRQREANKPKPAPDLVFEEPTHEMSSRGASDPFGMGGRMSDDAVRKATRKLEERLVSYLASLGYAPMTYR